MTPKEQAELAQKLWEYAKKNDEWPDEMRMAYIMGVVDGITHYIEEHDQ